MQYIYQIINRNTGKFYIGRSKSFKSRFSTHKKELRGGYHPNIHLQRAWNQEGEEVFDFVIFMRIDTGDKDKDEKLARINEQLLLDFYFPLDLLYNLSTSSETGVLRGEAHTHYGKKGLAWMSPEAREKVYYHLKTRDISGDKNPFYGRSHSEETLRILREKCAMYGEDNPFYGRSHSEESRKRISESKKGQGSGDKNPVARSVSVNGVTYTTVKEAARATGVCLATFHKRLKSDKYPEYFYID